jgi:tetratricopeptide (TPR) repeat protein
MIAALVIFFSGFGVYAQSAGIVWEKDFKKAQQAARESGRPLLLDFTAKWCEPCKAMDKEFWVRDDVIAAVKSFIAVKVDFDGDRGVVGKYGVSAIPFVIFADPLGNLITFRRGFSRKNVNELNLIFNEMPKDFSPMLKFYDALDQQKDNGIALLQIANAYRGAKMVRLSNEFFKKALKTPEIRNDLEKRENAYLSLGVNYLNLKDFAPAIDTMEDLLKTEPTGETRETALYFITLASAYFNKLKDADKYFLVLKTEFPASKNLEKAEAAINLMRNQKKP